VNPLAVGGKIRFLLNVVDFVKLLISLLFLIGYLPAAHANFSCADLVGMWSGGRYDSTLSSERRTIKAMNADGTYWVKFVHDNGGQISTQEESGKWTCKGDVLGIEINKIDEKSVYFYNEYQLVNPTAFFHSIRPVSPNCSAVIGDCSEDLLLEYRRVLN